MARDRIAETRARRALQGVGLENPEYLERAASTRNEVHLSPKYVVRVNCQPTQRLRREAMLCREFPDDRYFPSVLGFGAENGYDFVVVERKPGRPVSRTWPVMSQEQRRAFIRQFALGLKKLHSVATPQGIPKGDSPPHLLSSETVSPLVPALMAIDELTSRREIDRMLLQDLADMVNDHGPAIDDYHGRTLIHGDLSFENVMIDINGLSGLLDFEWCRGAPADLELDILLRFFRHPEAHLPADVEHTVRCSDFVDVPGWIAEDYPELFEHPRIVERLALYSVAFDLAELLAMKELSALSAMSSLHPLKRLEALLDGVSPLRVQLQRLSLNA